MNTELIKNLKKGDVVSTKDNKTGTILEVRATTVVLGVYEEFHDKFYKMLVPFQRIDDLLYADPNSRNEEEVDDLRELIKLENIRDEFTILLEKIKNKTIYRNGIKTLVRFAEPEAISKLENLIDSLTTVQDDCGAFVITEGEVADLINFLDKQDHQCYIHNLIIKIFHSTDYRETLCFELLPKEEVMDAFGLTQEQIFRMKIYRGVVRTYKVSEDDRFKLLESNILSTGKEPSLYAVPYRDEIIYLAI